MVQIIREALIDWPAEGPLELVAPAIKVNVTVSPSLARRRANGYLGSEVAMTLLAHNPRLVVGDFLCWRFDVDLSLPGVGVIATLGAIDVDADSGAVLPLSPAQIEEILRRAHALAIRIASPTAASIFINDPAQDKPALGVPIIEFEAAWIEQDLRYAVVGMPATARLARAG